MDEARKLDQNLRLARAAFSPSSAQQQRVRAALAGRLAAAGGAASAATSLATLSSKAAPRTPALTKGTLILGVGFALGYWTAERHARDQTVPDRQAPALAAPSAAPANASSSAALPPPSAAPTDYAEPDLELRRKARAGAAAASAASGSSKRRKPLRPGASRTAARTPFADSRAHRDTAAEEIALLQRAERAIRAGDGALARALISDLESRFPQTTLREERAAVLVLAACTLDEAGAESGAREFLELHLSSVYFDRIQTLCNLDGSRSATPHQSNGSGARGH